ncbi:MAG: hypothetical protein R3C56_28440 [Pirellulaceae bacterium]
MTKESYRTRNCRKACARQASALLLGDWLIQSGHITRPQLGQALSRQFEVPYEEIDVSAINPQVIRLLPEKLCSENPAIGYRQTPVAFGHVGLDDIETIAGRVDDRLFGGAGDRSRG